MTIAFTDAAAHLGLNAIYDGFNSGKIRIWTGSPPGPAAAPTGTLLVDEDLPATAFNAAASGSKTKAGTWQVTGSGAGNAGYYRLLASGDTGAAVETQVREEGTVTASGGGGDLTLDNINIAVGQTVTITSFTRSL
jgi:hypothetical protein